MCVYVCVDCAGPHLEVHVVEDLLLGALVAPEPDFLQDRVQGELLVQAVEPTLRLLPEHEHSGAVDRVERHLGIGLRSRIEHLVGGGQSGCLFILFRRLTLWVNQSCPQEYIYKYVHKYIHKYIYEYGRNILTNTFTNVFRENELNQGVS